MHDNRGFRLLRDKRYNEVGCVRINESLGSCVQFLIERLRKKQLSYNDQFNFCRSTEDITVLEDEDGMSIGRKVNCIVFACAKVILINNTETLQRIIDKLKEQIKEHENT